ncbi:MAG: VanZ family protein [Pseudomonadota bacterium]
MLPLSQWLVGAELRWFRLWLGLGLILIAAVFYLSLTPVDIPAEHLDKIYHAATYGVMMGWFVQLYRGVRSHAILAVGFILMGVLIEVLQGFHPMRYFDVLDMLANAVGVLIAWAIGTTAFSRILVRFESLLH